VEKGGKMWSKERRGRTEREKKQKKEKRNQGFREERMFVFQFEGLKAHLQHSYSAKPSVIPATMEAELAHPCW